MGARRPDAPAGIGGRIDHIAQVIPSGQLDTWVLFYGAVLGLAPKASTLMIDPYGVIKSRALESDNQALRIALNASERPNTTVGRSLGQFGGAGVHHIAIAVDDVVATVQALRERGAPMLKIPANYYDDLAAKIEVDDATLAAWQQLDIMVERQGGAEFLHAYSLPFDGRFFFEVIERRGGYDGYGAADAPVRLAALAMWQSTHPSETS
jgi:4-hydroxyphenylpyruvate dioxygenase